MVITFIVIIITLLLLIIMITIIIILIIIAIIIIIITVITISNIPLHFIICVDFYSKKKKWKEVIFRTVHTNHLSLLQYFDGFWDFRRGSRFLP